MAKFNAAQQMFGYDAHLSYNTALCHYRLKDFAPALKNIADIIERGIREHPELSVGMQTEGIEVVDVCRCLSAPLSEKFIYEDVTVTSILLCYISLLSRY